MTTTDSIDIDRFIAGTGSPSAKFDVIGKTVRGTVTDFEITQARDIDTGNPATWPDGNPKMQLVITLATDERDPSIEDDDGTRRIFAKKPSGMLKAISEALKTAGAKLEVGAVLAVQYTGDGEPTKRGFNAPKNYKAQINPAPPQSLSSDDLL